MEQPKDKLTKEFLFIEYIDNDKTTRQIAKEIGCTSACVAYWLKKHNISKHFKSIESRGKISKEKLYQLYCIENKNCPQIAKELGVQQCSVYERLKKYGWLKTAREVRKNQRRRIQVNLELFKEWSSDMAWILGFTMADGSVNSKYQYVRWQINSKDIEILEFIKDKVVPDGNIYYVDSYGYNGDRDTPEIMCGLSICSVELCEILKRYNILHRKTGKEILPQIPDEYKADYLRGLFDGDGFYSITNVKNTKRKTYCWGLSSGDGKFLELVNEELTSNLGTVYQDPRGHAATLLIKKASSIKEISEFMYKDHYSFYLKRKYNKWIEINDYINR